MQKNVDEIVTMLNEKLRSNFNDFRGAYLYGSCAKNTNNIDSDIDIVALFDSVDRQKRSLIWKIVGRIEAKYSIYIDLHPITKEELERNPIYYNEVVNKGIFYNAA